LEKLAPDIFRQRLLLEGFYTVEMTKEILEAYLLQLAANLNLRTYREPIVFSPVSGMGREENSGFDAFVPLIDSGISAYVWSQVKFFSIVLYTCKGFDENKAIQFTRDYFGALGKFQSKSF
jgi:S-adenosylmethionine decarboxylase